MLALPPPELRAAVAVGLGVDVRLRSLRDAGRTTVGRAMRSVGESPTQCRTVGRPARPPMEARASGICDNHTLPPESRTRKAPRLVPHAR